VPNNTRTSPKASLQRKSRVDRVSYFEDFHKYVQQMQDMVAQKNHSESNLKISFQENDNKNVCRDHPLAALSRESS